VSKASADKAAASKAATEKAKAVSSSAATSSSQAEAERKNAMLSATTAAVSQSTASLTDEVIPQAAAPALAETAQQPAKTDNSYMIIIAILALILSASVVFERKLNKLLRKTKYIPEKDMVFQRIYHRIKK
jgi:cobalamin biosynthesis Mg chelatase CobN